MMKIITIDTHVHWPVRTGSYFDTQVQNRYGFVIMNDCTGPLLQLKCVKVLRFSCSHAN